MIANQQVIRDFRIIMKHINKLPSFKEETSTLRKQIISMYATGRNESNTDLAETLRANANAYAIMVRDVSMLKYLRGLDSGEKLDPRDKIKATAARVGLGVPKFADENDFYTQSLKAEGRIL